MNKKLLHMFLLAALTSSIGIESHAQEDSTKQELIAVIARPYADSIVLRWAPRDQKTWQSGNERGYRIERFTVTRNGNAVSPPEKIVLQVQSKPIPVEKWEALVKVNKYAAIAAQALFGDRFEVDLSKSDLFSIVNKVRENEQRFAFALFSADMSPVVAKASGIWYSDKSVKKGENYLYRIFLNDAPVETRGSLFINAEEGYRLPAPQNLETDNKENQISLRWEKSGFTKYTAYIVERSIDGKLFTPISEVPLITLTPEGQPDNRYEYATDSLVSTIQTAYYRVRGLTPFGESSIYSNIAKVTTHVSLTEVPYIKEGTSSDNKSIHLQWEFPIEQEHAIKGFSVERSAQPKGNFLTLSASQLPTTRMYEDKTPQQVNYYRITAIGKDGIKLSSPVHLVNLIDSLPPTAPTGLKAVVSNAGHVTLSWQQNSERDLYGYRVYRAKHENERREAVLLTDSPVIGNYYTDTLNLKTLNREVYYGVMAIDKNQNHSPLSTMLKVELPDKIKPQTPSMLPVSGSEKGAILSWMRSSSPDVVQYDIYRRGADRNEWQRIKIVPANTSDTVYTWTDEFSTGTQHYSITAVDVAGLESEPTMPMRGGKINTGLQEAIIWKAPVLRREQQQAVLNWQYEKSNVKAFRIFRAVDDSVLTVYKTIDGNQREYSEAIEAGKKYTYRIMALFETGQKSELSKELIIAN